MSDDILIKKLGRCWAFPPSFSPETGVAMAEGIDTVLQSLRVLFLTEPGERIMRETYGAGMNRFIFRNIDEELMADMRSSIEESILRYEPRAVLKDVLIQPAQNDVSRLLVQITVSLINSDINETLVGTLDLNKGQTLRLL